MPKVTEIPVEARGRFEGCGGIPVDVVAELFARSEAPAAVQAAFWEAVLLKDIQRTPGARVMRIVTRRNGTQVVIDDGKGHAYTFEVPDEMTEEQLEEMKRAQSHGLPVNVEFQTEGKKKTVNAVEVWEKGSDKPGGAEGELV
jgi:hypothetical protein